MRSTRDQRAISLLLLLLVFADLLYSFWQHYHGRMDGDMAPIILPDERYSHVLKDPFGLQALANGVYYAAPNRFMPHWSMERFYKFVPFLLQRVVTPLDSIYIAGAIAKGITQALLLYLMSAFASGTTKVFNKELLLAALAITPLFQTFGFNRQIGIIDESITYSFFYALATAWLLLFFLPYFLYYFHQKPLQFYWWQALGIIPLAWIISFNGPLNSAVILLVCPVLLAYMVYSNWRIRAEAKQNLHNANQYAPKLLLLGLVVVLCFAALSFYIGRFNIENMEQSVALLERYKRLPKGLKEYFVDGPAPSLLFGAVVLNLVVANVFRIPSARALNRLSILFLLFAIAFIILLPLGGYRSYRPLIIRRDSIQPVLIGVFILYGLSFVRLLQHLKGARRLYPLAMLAFLSVYFTVNDEPGRGYNHHERDALARIATSPKEVVAIEDQNYIMAWGKISDTSHSKVNSQLLYYWRVFPELKYYYQK